MIHKIKILIFISFFFYCCTNTKKESMFNLGKTEEVFENINSYFQTINLYSIDVQDTPTLHWVFTNNPYSINDEYGLCLFANNKCVYKGKFKKFIPLDLGDLISTNERLHLSFEILTPSNSNKPTYLHRFSTKNTIVWESNYRLIYTCFFPTNDHDDGIYFFPQK